MFQFILLHDRAVASSQIDSVRSNFIHDQYIKFSVQPSLCLLNGSVLFVTFILLSIPVLVDDHCITAHFMKQNGLSLKDNDRK